MTYARRDMALGLAAAAALALSVAPASAQDARPSGTLAPADCFQVQQWEGWNSPGPGVIYLSVRRNDVYRVDLVNPGQRLDKNGRFLVNQVRGSSRVCGPLDLDLSIADTLGFSIPLFPRALTKLTSAEVAALPAEHRP